jgi:N-formylglutamate amidohydrolase
VSAAAPFEVLAPDGVEAPVVAHVPHASSHIPDDLRAEILLSDDELDGELLRLTDWYTDELFGWVRQLGGTCFINRLSRLVFDPERFLDDEAEPMAARGQGVVYWRDTQGRPLRTPDAQLRRQRVDELYRPYHAALDAVVGRLLAGFGVCTVLDCHSFPSLPLPSEIDQAPDRPDICIGTDATHTPLELSESMAAAFTAEGFRVRRDSPFAGTFVPSGFYGRDRRVRSVMVEVRRGLYMDEATARRRHDFDEIVAAVRRGASNGLRASPGR